MKKSKHLFFILISTFFIGKINAQWSITPNIGINNTRIIVPKSPIDLNNAVANFVAFGVAPRYRLNKKFAIETNFQYSEKGMSRSKLTFIDVIPTFEYSPLPYLSFYSGVNVGAKVKGRFLLDKENWKESDFLYSLYDKYNVGAILGLRAKYKNVQLGFHADRGLRNVSTTTFNDDNGDVIKSASTYYLIYQLNLGYTIDFKAK